MKLNLTKPLVVFDLETTGTDVVKDRIIQLSYIKISPDQSEKRENLFVNPCRPIPAEVTKLTGVTNEQVATAPTFKELAPRLAEEFRGCDFAGFNSNHFDIPLLAEEFYRAGINFDFSESRLIDAMTIYHKMERRNLAAAYEFYCDRKMEEDFEAHRADQDTEATYRVLMGMLDKYNPDHPIAPEKILPNDMSVLADYSKTTQNIDFAGRLVWAEKKDADGKVVVDENGKPVMQETINFGKYKGRSVAEILRRDPSYYSWIMNSDFSFDTKQAFTRIRLNEQKKNQ